MERTRSMDDCMFCKIARGEIPATVVYEDDRVIAFDDIAPQAPVHTLIIPKYPLHESQRRYRRQRSSGAVFGAVQHVARIKGVGASGYRVIVNNGHDANQTVKHLHVHVMGGRPMAHGMVVFADEVGAIREQSCSGHLRTCRHHRVGHSRFDGARGCPLSGNRPGGPVWRPRSVRLVWCPRARRRAGAA